MTSPASNLANSQPDLVLPVEIMIQIFQDYAAFRLTEPPTDPTRTGRYGRLKAVTRKWLVVPILQTCKLFTSLMLPEVYREVHLMHEDILREFFHRPRLDAYKYVRSINFSYLTDGTDGLGRIGQIIDNRVFQSQVVNYQIMRHQYGSFKSSASKPEEYLEDWKREKLHKLKTVHTDARSLSMLHKISSL